MTDSLDCKFDSSLRLKHPCSWEMIVPIQNVALLTLHCS